MLTIVGVGHAFPIREQVKHVIFSRHPGVVALELDKLRLNYLRYPEARKGGKASLMFRALHHIEERVASMYGVELGDEMLAGFEAAQAISARVALIDRDIRLTQQRLGEALSWWEKVKLAGSLVASVFARKQHIEAALEQVVNNEEEVLRVTRETYPAFYRVLIEERNEVLAANLRKLNGEHANIVALIGDLHVNEVRRLLGDIDHEVIRFKELRDIEVGTVDYSVSFEVPAGDGPIPEAGPMIDPTEVGSELKNLTPDDDREPA